MMECMTERMKELEERVVDKVVLGLGSVVSSSIISGLTSILPSLSLNGMWRRFSIFFCYIQLNQ